MSDPKTEAQVRVLIRIPARLKAKIAELAQRQRRSMNKQIEFLLDKSIREETSRELDTSSKRGKRE
jgi:hypothetical protein